MSGAEVLRKAVVIWTCVIGNDSVPSLRQTDHDLQTASFTKIHSSGMASSFENITSTNYLRIDQLLVFDTFYQVMEIHTGVLPIQHVQVSCPTQGPSHPFSVILLLPIRRYAIRIMITEAARFIFLR